jgi:predicted ATPase
MEFVPGDDLAALLVRRTAPFPLAEVLAWADRLLDALAYLHGQEPPVLHLDVKPANVKLDERGEALLLDFGLARRTGQTAGAFAGYTLAYAAPEQLRGAALDARTDLFALAATLFDLLTGRPPPDAPRRLTAVAAGEPDPLPPPDRLDPAVPSPVAAALAWALALDPADRPADAALLRAALRAATDDKATITAAPVAAGRPPGLAPASIASAGNLPAPPTALLGREAEVAALSALLAREDVWLVTLTGPGGTGKTRLALEVASLFRPSFPDGAWGEREFPVAPLALPDATPAADLAVVARSPAVALFVTRAAAVRPDFALTATNARDVAAICARLDELPLAIELAAARAKLLPPATLLARLDERLTLLTGGPRDLPERQQTLRNAIAWSHDLLSPAEQTLFRRLAVFAGGFTLEGAQGALGAQGVQKDERARELTGGSDQLGPSPARPAPPAPPAPPLLDSLAALLDHSLIRQIGGEGESRCGMLETIRAFALAELAASGEEDEVRRWHAAYYAGLVETAADRLTGPEQATWLDRVDAEWANLFAALDWAIARQEAEPALRLATELASVWLVRGQVWDGLSWLRRALALAERAPASLRVLAHHAGANVALAVGDAEQAERWFERTLAEATASDDQRAQATALGSLGRLARLRGDLASGEELMGRALALFRRLGEPRRAAVVLNNLGATRHDRGDLDGAIEAYEESLGLFAAVGDERGRSRPLSNLGGIAMERGELARARVAFREALAICTALGDKRGVADVLANLGELARHEGDLAEAGRQFGESLTLVAEISDLERLADTLDVLAAVGVARRDGAAETAGTVAELAGAAAALRERHGFALASDEQRQNEETIAAARAILGEDAFAAAWAAGRSLAVEEAVAAGQRLARAIADAWRRWPCRKVVPRGRIPRRPGSSG